MPEKLHELQRLWLTEAVRYNVLPLDDDPAHRFNPDTAGRPVLIKGKTQLLFGGMGRLSENCVLNLKNKSHSVTAAIVVPEKGAEGVIVADADFIGGFSLWVDGKGLLHHTYSFLGVETYKQISREKPDTFYGLSAAGGKLIGTLSKGYQQRVGIAQAIVHAPDVVILDEPTVGLDPNQIREIRALIRELGGTHSVILSTHILPEVEAVCDRVQIMHHGNLVYNDTIAALKQMHSGTTVLLELRRPPPLAELAALTGVAAADAIEPTMIRIQFAPGQDPTEALVQLAVARDWGLHQLKPAQTSLEDVFVNLTRREENP